MAPPARLAAPPYKSRRIRVSQNGIFLSPQGQRALEEDEIAVVGELCVKRRREAASLLVAVRACTDAGWGMRSTNIPARSERWPTGSRRFGANPLRSPTLKARNRPSTGAGTSS